MLTTLRAKAAAPLDRMELAQDTCIDRRICGAHRAAITTISNALQACNAPIAIVKEQAAAANLAALTADLTRLQAVKTPLSSAPVDALVRTISQKRWQR